MFDVDVFSLNSGFSMWVTILALAIGIISGGGINFFAGSGRMQRNTTRDQQRPTIDAKASTGPVQQHAGGSVLLDRNRRIYRIARSKSFRPENRAARQKPSW